MHHKDIKAEIKKQLKKEYPNWKRRPNKEKKEIATAVLNEVLSNYDFEKEVETPKHELLGIEEQMISKDIMNLEEMKRFVDDHYSNKMFNFKDLKPCPYIKDDELKIIDKLLDDQIINQLLSYEGYSPAMREFSPSLFLRAELLKAIKYPEISYRKFCGDDRADEKHKANNPYTGSDQKQNRAFIGLGLRQKKIMSHVQLCQFRSKLTFSQMMNLSVYILNQFMNCGFLDDGTIHCVDSTELPSECQKLLAIVKIKGKNIRIYNDIDCDCGVRRKKRDKSFYVVGYRLHTLTAINTRTGHSYPLISLLAPANHHDSKFLVPLSNLGQAIGLDVKLITADEAYDDNNGELLKQAGIYLVKPANSKVRLPINVDEKTMQVTFDDLCEIPMEYAGADDEFHEFKCGATSGECIMQGACPRIRQIALDNGVFQRIPHVGKLVEDALGIRKNGERPFNLLKKREGLEVPRTRSQHGFLARVTFTSMATLLLEIAGTRKKKKTGKAKQEQLDLPLAA